MDPGNRMLPVGQNLRMLFTHVLLMVIYLHQSNSFLTGGPVGEVVPSYSQVIEGSNLTLNCTLKSYSSTPLRSSALYFVAVYLNIPRVVDAEFYHVLTRQTLQLVIPNVTRQDGNFFKCHMNDSDLTNSSDTFIGSATVDIGRPPNPIVDVSVVSDNFENMTVSWCPAVPQEDSVDSNLSWAIENSPYSGNCSVWTIASASVKHCSCIFCGTSASLSCFGKEQTYHNFQTYNITITSFNSYGSTSTSLQVYTDSTIVKPRPVQELVVTPLSSRSLQASWIYPVNPSVLSLMYQINVFSEWGLNSTIDAGNNTSWVITDLTPGTLYTVAVRCKPPVEGYWSDDNVASAKTMEDVPAVAPESPTGFFRTSVCLEKDGCPVTIFWKLINASMQSGVILGYRLTIESTLCTNSCKIDVNDGYATSADIGLADGVSSWVRLVAYTSVGESPPHYIFFPRRFKSLPNIEVQGLYAEYTEDDTGIFFSWNYDDGVDNRTLMYCAGKQTDKTHCLTSPVNATLLRHQTNFTISPFNIDHVYAMSSNYKNGTSGLTPNWICIYEYSGLPAMPELKSTTQVSDTSMKVVWSPLTCTTDGNRVRVLNYTLSYINSSTLENTSVTLPGNVTEYTITDMTPEVEYTLTLRGVSRSGAGQPATSAIITDPANPVNIVVAVAVSVAVAFVVVIIIFGSVYASWKSHRWCNSVTITPPEKYENTDVVNETIYTNDNYAAISDSGSNLHANADVSSLASTSIVIDVDSSVPSCQTSHHDRLVMIPNENADLYEELLVPSLSANDTYAPLADRIQQTTEHSESVDSMSSNQTTSTSCESDHSIQTYTAAVASPETPSESPSFHSPLISYSLDSDHLPNYDNNPVELQPSIKESTPDSSDSYGYSQAHQCNNLNSSVDSSSSCDDYKTVRFKEGSFEEPIGEPVAPQFA